jgi:two-component system OmpR family response regulator
MTWPPSADPRTLSSGGHRGPQRRVAIVEDVEVILGNYSDFLSGLGFIVEGYASRSEAEAAFARSLPQLVLLDISLGGERDAGFAICAALRRVSTTLPIIFLSSHDEEMDKVSAFRLGADDYITKDVSLDYLVIRIEAMFRRLDAYASAGWSAAAPEADPSDSVVFDPRSSRASWRGRSLDITLTQTWILQDLCAHPGMIRTHAELMQAGRIVVEANTIAAHMKAIRDALLQVDPRFDRIRTERSRGYRWMPAD